MIKDELRPFLKWPGGKTRELKLIIPNLPSTVNHFYEPFVGGGAVYFAVTKAIHYFINDKSKDLIDLYIHIKNRDNALFLDALTFLNHYWKQIDLLYFEHRDTLWSIFFQYRHSQTSDLKKSIAAFIDSAAGKFTGPVPNTLNFAPDVYTGELAHNLQRKMIRMKSLERTNGFFADGDIDLNILTALKSAFYMYLRTLYNRAHRLAIHPMIYSAIYFFIRNYCYSGMFRYNSKGEFNVPYGGMGYNGNSLEKKINSVSGKAIREKLENTTIENVDFYDFMKTKPFEKNDFIFLDPPYDTEFSTYDKNEFTPADQIRLSAFLLNETPCNWMLIIKNTPFIHKLYEKKGIYIHSFDKSYNVSFMNRNNRDTEHFMITNYKLTEYNPRTGTIPEVQLI
jgi:DNA adenine methylase